MVDGALEHIEGDVVQIVCALYCGTYYVESLSPRGAQCY